MLSQGPWYELKSIKTTKFYFNIFYFVNQTLIRYIEIK